MIVGLNVLLHNEMEGVSHLLLWTERPRK